MSGGLNLIDSDGLLMSLLKCICLALHRARTIRAAAACHSAGAAVERVVVSARRRTELGQQAVQQRGDAAQLLPMRGGKFSERLLTGAREG